MHVLLAQFSKYHPWQAIPSAIDEDSFCEPIVFRREEVIDGICIDT